MKKYRSSEHKDITTLRPHQSKMSNFFTFLFPLFLAIDQLDGLHCYYCLPCDESNMKRVDCDPSQSLCSYLEGLDPFGEFRVGRLCAVSKDVKPNSCMESDSYLGLKSVKGCFCDVDFCNDAISIKKFALDLNYDTDLEREVMANLLSKGSAILSLKWLLLISMEAYFNYE